MHSRVQIRVGLFNGQSLKERVPRPGGRRFAYLCVIIAAFILVGHGCHGPDEDHEPGFAVPRHFEAPSPK